MNGKLKYTDITIWDAFPDATHIVWEVGRGIEIWHIPQHLRNTMYFMEVSKVFMSKHPRAKSYRPSKAITDLFELVFPEKLEERILTRPI